jgi:hypothetical protein
LILRGLGTRETRNSVRAARKAGATLSETAQAAKPPCHDAIYMKFQELDCNRATYKAAMLNRGSGGIAYRL